MRRKTSTWRASEALIPIAAFYNVYSMWAAPLYGEVKGATSVGKTFWSMQGVNWSMNVLCVLYLVSLVSLVGYNFFQDTSWLFWYGETTYTPLFPGFPGYFIYVVTGNAWLTFFVLFFNFIFLATITGAGILLPSTRVLFAMAFDRVMPEFWATLKTRARIPLAAFTWTSVMALVVSYFYVYTGFATAVLDAALVIIVMYAFTLAAAMLLPYMRKELWKGSPAAKYYIGRVPVITICGAIALVYQIYLIARYFSDPAYGVTHPISLIYLAILYAGSIACYFGFKYYRRNQGIDVSMVFREIPAE